MAAFEHFALGVGQAQVRTAASAANVPGLAVGSYALLQLAALATYGDTGQPREFRSPSGAETTRPRAPPPPG